MAARLSKSVGSSNMQLWIAQPCELRSSRSAPRSFAAVLVPASPSLWMTPMKSSTPFLPASLLMLAVAVCPCSARASRRRKCKSCVIVRSQSSGEAAAPAARSNGKGRRELVPRSEVMRSAARVIAVGAAVGDIGPASAKQPAKPNSETGRVVRTVNGIRHRQLGSTDIAVSEVGLGTQRWGSADFNAPDEKMCFKFMDKAILEGGVNLVDTAEQYPIPSDPLKPEGLTEEIIGRWIAQDRSRRDKIVIATKITGGLNVNKTNIRRDLEGSLKRLQTDCVDVYLTHWSFRISQPQQNWGQSLQYRQEDEPYAQSHGQSSFEEVALAMDALRKEGKIRGWGCCNESPYGATRLVATAKALGVTPPCVFQNDYSLLNRRCEENGLFEMMSPYNEGVGFMAYNVLAGGMLTGKYLEEPAAVDQESKASALKRLAMPRGRMDDFSWGQTLYRYRSDAAVDATRRYAEISKAAGISLTELALRWVRQRDGVTTALLGQSSLAQLEEDLNAFRVEKALPERLLWEVDRVHMRNRLPIFSSQRVQPDWNGSGEIGEPIP
eukprot:TRINITY_DN106472_c0_g1_i1.p1 TRINITY_DN106472_c0_g1~~TRINITY_DN106472_c0_g1_i1.p1  ORF type:complete len:559 (+),score=76.87 TRINITY_DN106472_c0_g1_i1:24-1679(+)